MGVFCIKGLIFQHTSDYNERRINKMAVMFNMPYDSRSIANYLIELAQKEGKSLDIMQLLKLVYIAHGWNLALLNRPLINQRIEAWKHGPVIPELYHTFRKQGINNLHAIEQYQADLDEDTQSIVKQTYGIYGHLSSFALSDVTHKPETPWDISSKLGGFYAPIPNSLIKKHYQLIHLEADQKAS